MLFLFPNVALQVSLFTESHSVVMVAILFIFDYKSRSGYGVLLFAWAVADCGRGHRTLFRYMSHMSHMSHPHMCLRLLRLAQWSACSLHCPSLYIVYCSRQLCMFGIFYCVLIQEETRLCQISTNAFLTSSRIQCFRVKILVHRTGEKPLKALSSPSNISYWIVG